MRSAMAVNSSRISAGSALDWADNCPAFVVLGWDSVPASLQAMVPASCVNPRDKSKTVFTLCRHVL